MRASERVNDDLFGVGGILGDGETETEDAVLVAVEERVERLHVAVARRVHELAIAPRLDVRDALRLTARHHSSARYRRTARRFRSGASVWLSTTPPDIGACR